MLTHETFFYVLSMLLCFVCGLFCRRRNQELLQEDGLRVRGTVHGEGPVWTWTGLMLDNGFMAGQFLPGYTHKCFITVIFLNKYKKFYLSQDWLDILSSFVFSKLQRR